MKLQIDETRLAEVFRSLVEVYSPSGKEEAVLGFLEEFFVGQGCPYGVQPVDEDRYNLVLGRGDARLVMVGHVDTVTAWDLEDIGPEDLEDGWVRGLGTADMKGGCAAMVEAYLTLRQAGLGNRVGLALVVGEEEEGDGAETFLREARPKRALVGEPTGLRLCNGHYGYVEVQLSAVGRKAHASVPERGANAAEAVLRVVHDLLQTDELQLQTGPVLSIRHLETSNPGFAVPSWAAAWVDVHVPPDYPTHRVRTVVDRIAALRGDGRVTVEYPVEHQGFRVSPEDELVRAYREVADGELDVFRSHSDANVFHAVGVSTVVLGPGNLEYAHSEEERIAFPEVVEASRLYVDLALAMAG